MLFPHEIYKSLLTYEILIYTLENGLLSLRKLFKSSNTTHEPGSTPDVGGTAGNRVLPGGASWQWKVNKQN